LYPELIGISMSTLSDGELKIVASNYTEEIGNLSGRKSIDVYENGEFSTGTITMANGERAFTAIAPIHVGGQIFGVYNIKISLKAEEEMIAGQQRNVVAVILISIIILVGILYSLLSLMVIRPIAKIKEGLTKIANGDLSQRFTSKSKDEIGDLAESLNGMVEKLEGFYKNLESLVRDREETIQERTKEIQTKLADLERFNKLTVGRELKMKQLKEEIEKLKEEIKRLENEK
jgi:methyl-accepting chemotaxis protein